MMKNATRGALTLLMVLMLLTRALPSEGAAQGRPFDRGLRLGLATGLVDHGEATYTLGGRDESQTATGYGLADPRFGIDIGGLPLPFLAVGITAWIFGTSESSGAARAAYGFLPYVEGDLRLGDVVMLFARFDIGGVADATATNGGTASRTLFAVGGRVGGHFFVIPEVSISPYVATRYGLGGFELPTGDTGSVAAWWIDVGVSLSAWFDLASPPSGPTRGRRQG